MYFVALISALVHSTITCISCQQLFLFFQISLLLVFVAFLRQLDYIIITSIVCQQLFLFNFSSERRRRDLNPRAAVNDLHPFQGCPFGQLGYFSRAARTRAIFISYFYIEKEFSRILLYGISAKRRGWDSNPCALADKRFSRPPRYDHFDTSPNCLLTSEHAYLIINSITCQYLILIFLQINLQFPNPRA